jgi:hypothetical protein
MSKKAREARHPLLRHGHAHASLQIHYNARMPDQSSREKTLAEELSIARQEYFALERIWKDALAKAHACEATDLDCAVKHLTAANDIGPQVLTALNRYQTAMHKLLESRKAQGPRA